MAEQLVSGAGEWEQLCSPISGEPDVYLWRQESWSGRLSRATRPEFSLLLWGEGVPSAPMRAAAGLCPGLLRAQKACLCSQPHSGSDTWAQERGGREKSIIGSSPSTGFMDGELSRGRLMVPAAQDTTNSYYYS